LLQTLSQLGRIKDDKQVSVSNLKQGGYIILA